MEENSAALECLIVFYISMKHVLKTRQLTGSIFLDKMVKHCRICGFINYSDSDIRNMWKTLVTKYTELKSKGTVEDKENWKYFEILDSCYEESDFHNEGHSKFSEEMVWLLIECFWKRKGLLKSQKHSVTINEIHKEFVRYGYSYITRQDIENKWRYLNIKYNKLRNDPDNLKKIPYLQALEGFHSEKGKYINMIFTRELTEILIERFTEKKITCVIHGYDSDQVLSEIQSEFKDLGFCFFKEDIKEKWRTLTNIYKFLIAKGKCETTWIHFKAMENHFKNDYLLSLSNDLDKEIDRRPRRLRERSKSVDAEMHKRNMNKKTLVVKLDKEKYFAPKIKLKGEQVHSNKKKSNKRTNENYLINSPKKLIKLINVENNMDDNNMNNTSQTRSILNIEEDTELNKQGSQLSVSQKLERRTSADIGSPTSKVHIINIDHSEIDKKSGNLTINLPSITKQFSDNEFLPLKKRLRVEGDGNKHTSTKGVENGFLGFPTKEVVDSEKHITDINNSKRLTEAEMTEIMERINKEKSQNSKVNDTQINEINTKNYCIYEESCNLENIYNFNQQCLITPKEEQKDNLSVQNYSNSSTTSQPPVLLLVIKVDGSNNPLKDSNSTNEVNLMDETNSFKCSTSENNMEIQNNAELLGKQVTEQTNTISDIPTTDFTESDISINGKTSHSEGKKLDQCCMEASTVDNNYVETVSDFVSSNNSRISEPSSVVENEQNNKVQNSIDVSGIPTDCDFNDFCSVAEDITVYTTENNETSHCKIQNKVLDEQNTEIILCDSPTPDQIENSNSTRIIEKTPMSIADVKVLSQTIKNQTSTEKIRLPVKSGGKLKEIFISPRELSKIAKLKPNDFRNKKNILKNNLPPTTMPNTSGFKFVSHVIKPSTTETLIGTNLNKTTKFTSETSTVATPEGNFAIPPPLLKLGSKSIGERNNSQIKNGQNEEFENESVISEAVVDDDALRDNLLATVIDFEEQNSQEFTEIKNLLKENNILHRETNRLLRLILEKQ